MSTPKQRLVIVSTWFPPIQGIAVNRMLAFTKYFDKSKYEVFVITLKTDDSKPFEKMHDANIYRLENNSLFKLPQFNSTDSRWKHKIKVLWKMIVLKLKGENLNSWRKKAVAKLNELHKEKPIDIIISSFAPATPHLVTLDFLKKKSGIKWVADMRDEMSRGYENSKKTQDYLHKIEKEIEKRASALVTTSVPKANYFKELVPKIPIIEEIRNGFDNDFNFEIQPHNDTFTFLFAGKLYGLRSPHTFFEALLNCKDYLPEKWKITFLGTSRTFKIPVEFVNNVEFVERVPQEESLRKMSQADANMIFLPTIERKGNYPGKVFDYLSVRRPVLAVVDKTDVTAKLVKELNGGFVGEFDSIPEIEKAIKDCVDLWKNKEALTYKEEGIKQLHRKYQVQKLESMLDRMEAR